MAKARSKSTGKRGRPPKSGNKKKSAPAHELPGGFWRQIVAILLALLGVFLILTWMGDGGNLLNSVDVTLKETLGIARYFIPALLFAIAFKIFKSDNNRVAPVVWTASILMLLWLAGAFGLAGVDEGAMNGGSIGAWLNGFATELLNPSVAVIIYIILIFVTAAFILQLNPAEVFSAIGSLFRTTEAAEKPVKAEKKTAEKKTRAAKDDVEIEIHETVAGGNDEEPLKPQPKLSMFSKLGFGKNKDKDKTEAAEVVEAEMDAGKNDKVSDPSKALVEMSDPDWKKPSISLLENGVTKPDAGDGHAKAKMIQSTLAEFGIDVEMEGINVGPRVTQYTMRPPSGVNLSKILARDKELALNLAVDKIRIEAPIPGTRLVGVELPNETAADVRLRKILESPAWKKADDPLTFAVGMDLSGTPVVANLAKMPHLLIAGTTGSGKSVMTNALISSLLYRNAPSDLKFIIVDPKQVEMAQYDDIPHLLTPIITSTDKALSALKWAVNEMEKRYTLMAEEKVKNIVDYNAKMLERAEQAEKAQKAEKVATAEAETKKEKKIEIKDADAISEDGQEDNVGNDQETEMKTPVGEKMPYIVVLIDEMADLMMLAGKDLEIPIVRIAQKGRAAGIHLVLATQRPEVKVITGLIKANIPGRIAFAVGSQIDSRVMLDMTGAEKLLGKGDMLMLTTEMMGKPRRIQGAWASDKDVMKLTDFLREQRKPEYNDEIISQPVQLKGMGPADGGAIGDMGRRYDPKDPIVRKAVEITLKQGKFSTASLQTWLGKGHGFVSGLAIWLEQINVIGPVNGHKPRDVLISSMEEFDERANSQ